MRPSENNPSAVILIGWDGADRRAVTSMLTKGDLPHLRKLSTQGSFAPVDAQGETDTRAGWAEILTGCTPSITGVYSNVRYNAIPCGHTIFERLKYHFGTTGIVTGAYIAKQGYVLTGDAPLVALDEYRDGLRADSLVAAEAISFIKRHAGKRFFLFAHFDGPDKRGHGFGEFSREYRSAIRDADLLTGAIMAQVRKSGLASSTAVYVTSDHGFDKGKTTHHNAPDVFLVSNDRSIAGSGTRLDITPTVLHRMGIDPHEMMPPVSGSPLSRTRLSWMVPHLQTP